MTKNKPWIGILSVGLALATGHAIRGQFGHEQGAAWAGAMGAMALVMVANRKDWFQKALLIALAMAIGWGAGGMISYGQIAGRYAQSDNFLNVFYGLSMLFVIGGLYGWLGGGLLGLTLNSTKEKPVKWGNVIAEMTAGALITHYFLIEQIGFKMTPPRGDYWAICLGAGLALVWYMARNGHFSPLLVTLYSTIGGGFGFAFGTAFHLVMNWIEIPFNTWNMAEYTIGFFGGIGMAYAVFTSEWPKESIQARKWESISSLLVVLVFIPLIIFRESFPYQKFIEKYQSFPNTEILAFKNTFTAALVVSGLIISTWYILVKSKFEITKIILVQIFVIYSAVYSLLSYISTDLFAGNFLKNSNHHLYLVNIIAIVLLSKNLSIADSKESAKITNKTWGIYTILILLSLFLMTWISIWVHGETGPEYDRFPMN